ncbi:DUF721 domain-containing protein [Pseudorhodoplanes sp.]|uniref:DUF721 domain-containing protein n=1 Tax=Pseudorhodoplanes sp. TaxID=1934341 RepID=UPI002CE1BAE8|nr:DciA family protein [Pseudorhodoplanes sp.]HWV42876.1 DciA family protein [Pseudorhodoplanes sp.]
MNKPRRLARPLPDIAASLLAESFRRQGFNSSELVVRWAAIVGEDVAAHAEPLKIQWQKVPDGQQPPPGTLVLRVDGPAAIEIQHMSHVILERVNRYFGFGAIGKIAIRQAPLRAARARRAGSGLNPQAVQSIAESLPDETDPALRDAIARLGAAIKGK